MQNKFLFLAILISFSATKINGQDCIQAGFYSQFEISKTYFFSGTSYSRQSYFGIDQPVTVDAEYPLPIQGDNNFSATWPWDETEAVFVLENAAKAYFFNNGEYLRYTFTGTGSLGDVDDNYPKPISQFCVNWPSSWVNIDATFYSPESNKLYVFQGENYIRLTFGVPDTPASVDDGYPLAIVDGFATNWPADWDSVDAAIYDPNSGKVFFFKDNQYLRYSFQGVNNIGTVDDDYPKYTVPNFSETSPWDCIANAVNSPQPDVNNSSLNVFPNPYSTSRHTKLSVVLSNVKKDQALIKVFNIQSELLIHHTETFYNNNSFIEIDINKLAKGVYILTIEQDGLILNEKFIILE